MSGSRFERVKSNNAESRRVDLSRTLCHGAASYGEVGAGRRWLRSPADPPRSALERHNGRSGSTDDRFARRTGNLQR